MNTRLQVEHPVTECITGLDLVELMIRVAAGEKLPFTQSEIKRNGWAIECRINAEDPLRGFLPSTGRLTRYQPPAEVPGAVRLDTGVYEGGEILMYYDSMIAKLIAHGATREEAAARMREALNAFVIRGVSSNIVFQSALLQHPRFASGRLTTAFIAEEYPQGFHAADVPHHAPDFLVAIAATVHRTYRERATKIDGQLPGYELKIGDDWVVMGDGRETTVNVKLVPGGCDVRVGAKTHTVRHEWRFGDIVLRGLFDGEPFCVQVERPGLKYRLTHMGKQVEFTILSRRAADLLHRMPAKKPPDMSRFLLSPMPGLLTEVAVRPGQEVKAGERLAVIEAMKMQNTLVAERDGKVEKLLAQPGESLAVDQAILSFQ
jgi:propionyl-CoA carboxylase alpha chain